MKHISTSEYYVSKGRGYMDTTFKIKPYSKKNGVIVLNTKQVLALGLDKNKLCFVSFGTQKHPIKIRISNKVIDEELLLSKDVIKALFLPTYPVYEIRIKDKEIIFGPYIGILYKRYHKSITNFNLEKWLIYTRNYSELNGALVIFALNKISKMKGLVEGFCYNPKTNSWNRGKFPYPSSIFCKFPLSKKWQKNFFSFIGDRWFNGYYMNKWKIYRWLSSKTDIKSHLPYTVLYQSNIDIFDFLQKFKKAFIKPIGGFFGKKIVQLHLKNEYYICKYIKKGKLINVITKDKIEIEKILNELLKPGKFIIQQYINLIKYEDKIIDFRCIIQKDHTMKWNYLGTIGRISAPNYEVIDFSSFSGENAKALPAIEILKDHLKLSEDEILNVRHKISDLALKVGNIINELRVNIGNIGLDIGIDQSGHLWLIELNHRNPNDGLDQFYNNMELYYKTKSTPLFYAKTLAGFN